MTTTAAPAAPEGRVSRRRGCRRCRPRSRPPPSCRSAARRAAPARLRQRRDRGSCPAGRTIYTRPPFPPLGGAFSLVPRSVRTPWRGLVFLRVSVGGIPDFTQAWGELEGIDDRTKDLCDGPCVSAPPFVRCSTGGRGTRLEKPRTSWRGYRRSGHRSPGPRTVYAGTLGAGLFKI